MINWKSHKAALAGAPKTFIKGVFQFVYTAPVVTGGIINGALEILVDTDFGFIEVDVEGFTIEVDTE